MDCNIYNTFIIKFKTKIRVKGKSLTKANEKKIDILYSKGFVS